jgi:hypothetical protein
MGKKMTRITRMTRMTPIWIIILGIFLAVVIVVALLSNIFNGNAENFSQNNSNEQNVSLEKFNDIFDSSMVILPENLVAFGWDGNHKYSHNAQLTEGQGRVDNFVEYFEKEIKPSLKKDKLYFVLCYWDGYLERIPYTNKTLMPFTPDKQEYLGKREIDLKDNSTYPILHAKKRVFAYSKHINDFNTICVPDLFFIDQHAYADKFKEIDNNNVDFKDKRNMCVWRGGLQNGSTFNFIDPAGKGGLNQRHYFKKLFDEGKIQNTDFSETKLTIPEQIKYKYILDIDGHSNTWDATAWKLYSGSVLLKTQSIWKQWFYDDFREWEHYVPVKNDFSDLNARIEWCIANDDKCKEIAENARKFAIKTYDWNGVRNKFINIFNDYV